MCGLLLTGCCFAAGTTNKPNFVIIFTDDQGYGDLSCFGGKHVSTPRIDQMAKEGMRLTSFYVAAPVCTPSRAALMTGCYPKRITEHAVKFIKKNKDHPFFLYIPHPIPHAPLHISPPFMKGVSTDIVAQLKKEDGNIDYRTRDRLFRQAIAEIDWSVGQILDTLKANGLDKNTLVLSTSDNGPPKNSLFASAGPLRGNKGTTFEGGMREPTVVRWPGRIPAGKDNDKLMTAMDLLPTFAKLAGVKVPTHRIIDGKDIWPVLSGNAKTPYKAFFYHRGNWLAAVRSGDWKLHLGGKGKPSALYNLKSDLGEKKDVLKAHPKVAMRLRGLLDAFAKDIAKNNRPSAFVKNPKPLLK